MCDFVYDTLPACLKYLLFFRFVSISSPTLPPPPLSVSAALLCYDTVCSFAKQTNKKATALAEARARSSSERASERAVQKAAWKVGAASAASDPSQQQRHQQPQPQQQQQAYHAKMSVGGHDDRETSAGPSFASSTVSAAASRGPSARTEGPRGGAKEPTRPRPKGAVGVGGAIGGTEGALKGAGAGGGGRGVSTRGGAGSALASVAVPAPAPAPVAAVFDLAGFVRKVERGVLLTKINRQGRAKVRTLFYDSSDKMLWWNETGAAAGRGSHRPRSSSLFVRKEQPLPVASLVEVRACVCVPVYVMCVYFARACERASICDGLFCVCLNRMGVFVSWAWIYERARVFFVCKRVDRIGVLFLIVFGEHGIVFCFVRVCACIELYKGQALFPGCRFMVPVSLLLSARFLPRSNNRARDPTQQRVCGFVQPCSCRCIIRSCSSTLIWRPECFFLW